MLLEIAIFWGIIWLFRPTPFLANIAILHTVQYAQFASLLSCTNTVPSTSTGWMFVQNSRMVVRSPKLNASLITADSGCRKRHDRPVEKSVL